MTNKRIAEMARETVKEYWNKENKIIETPFQVAAAQVAANLQADAKECIAIGKYEVANGLMNAVSVILFDIKGVDEPDAKRCIEARKQFQENYGQDALMKLLGRKYY